MQSRVCETLASEKWKWRIANRTDWKFTNKRVNSNPQWDPLQFTTISYFPNTTFFKSFVSLFFLILYFIKKYETLPYLDISRKFLLLPSPFLLFEEESKEATFRFNNDNSFLSRSDFLPNPCMFPFSFSPIFF